MKADDQKYVEEAYSAYGFTKMDDPAPPPGVLVFKAPSGYFRNVDIVQLVHDIDTSGVERNLREAGYAPVVRSPGSAQEVARALFTGYFEPDQACARISGGHPKARLRNGERPEYISPPYSALDFSSAGGPLVDTLLELLSRPGPALILLQAPATFGKTTTVRELARRLGERIAGGEEAPMPFVAELSKHRSANRLNHILDAELHDRFSGVGRGALLYELSRGRIALMLDGFDELIQTRGTDDHSEPLIPPLKEALRGEAKVIVTARGTALTEEGRFGDWFFGEEHSFGTFTLLIEAPRLEDWLTPSRVREVRTLPQQLIQSPLLLSTLRSCDDQEFEQEISSPHQLAYKLRHRILSRERERQDLRLSPSLQDQILRAIAFWLVREGIEMENASLIGMLIKEEFGAELLDARENYAEDDRPTVDALVGKMQLHAFLDASSDRSASTVRFVHQVYRSIWFAGAVSANAERDAALKQLVFGNPEEEVQRLCEAEPLLSEQEKEDLSAALQLQWGVWDPPPRLIARARFVGTSEEVLDPESSVGMLDLRHGSLRVSGARLTFFRSRFEDSICVFNVQQSLRISECEFTRTKVVFTGSGTVTIIDTECPASAITADPGIMIEYPGVPEPAAAVRDETTLSAGNETPSASLASSSIDILRRFWPRGHARPASLVRHRSQLARGWPRSSVSSVEAALEELRRVGWVAMKVDRVSLVRARLSEVSRFLAESSER